MEIVNWSLLNAPHEFDKGCTKPSSSILYGIVRKDTDLEWEDGKSAKQCKKD